MDPPLHREDLTLPPVVSTAIVSGGSQGEPGFSIKGLDALESDCGRPHSFHRDKE